MDDPSQLSNIARNVKALTVAVWCLVAINVVQVLTWLIPYIAPQLYVQRLASSSGIPRKAFESWEGLTLEEKLKRSSLILVTENRRDGDKMRAYIKDIPKRTPNTTFYFKVGDEYGPLSTNIREDTRYGDGALVLLHGSPATMKESYSIYGGSIAGLDEMPLAMVYKLIAQSQ
jgi:hypothetical protein